MTGPCRIIMTWLWARTPMSLWANLTSVWPCLECRLEWSVDVPWYLVTVVVYGGDVRVWLTTWHVTTFPRYMAILWYSNSGKISHSFYWLLWEFYILYHEIFLLQFFSDIKKIYFHPTCRVRGTRNLVWLNSPISEIPWFNVHQP